MTTVFIDADACPVTREAISVARSHGLSVVLVGNGTQSFDKHLHRNGVEAIQVGQGRDSADFAIVERLSPGDVVVTQDIGVAAMALGRGAGALSPRGRIFWMATIDAEMEVRHAEQRHRRSGGRTGGPSKFTEEDREHFVESLERVIRDRREASGA
ncbi:MAG: YaiI/YqxD family protein [Coriobacteriia bacterium]|jgi:uncharacterized protein YaiI (UPF0178 family)|nr:YaiI/YqxD family protein [Coriobacteriia bacterium]